MQVPRCYRPLLVSGSLALIVGLATSPSAVTATPSTAQGITAMTHHANGSFDVQITPQPAEDGVGAASIGRFGLFKQFHGDLEGTARGQMLAVRSPVAGSAGYVAMDFVEARLEGRTGTFALQHIGTMGPGQMRLDINVVPDSGTDELTGIDGTFAIIITDGKHTYDFAYTLPAKS